MADLSLFRMAYPNLDPLKCTLAVYEGYMHNIATNAELLQGRQTFESSHKWRVGEDNRKGTAKQMFPTYFAAELGIPNGVLGRTNS
jgi:hypothetical protein